MNTLLYWTAANVAMACVLGLLAGASKRWLRRPALTHALWVLVLLKLVTPPLGTFAVPVPMPEAPPPIEETPPALAVAPIPELPVVPDREVVQPDWIEAVQHSVPLQETQERVEPTPPPLAAAPVVPSPHVPVADTPALAWLLPSLGWLWLTGTLAWFTTACYRLIRFQRILQLAQPAPESVRIQARVLAERMGVACPDLVMVPGTVSPLLWVWRQQARLVLPASLLDRLSAEQSSTILTHELAHWRRADHWVRRLEMLVLGLYWWNPLVWIARRQLHEAEEECCDAWVVSTLPEASKAYALALVETLDFLAGAPAALPMGASGVGQLPSLQRRLSMILSSRPERSLTVLGGMVLAAAVLALLPWIPTWAQDGERPEKKRPPEEKKKGGFERDKPTPTIDRDRAEDELRKAREELERAQQRFQEKMRELHQGKGPGGDRPFPQGSDRPFPPGGPKDGDRPFPPPGGPKDGPHGPGPRGDLEKRLNDVERKLDTLLWELSNLRKEMGPRPGNPPPPQGGPKRTPGADGAPRPPMPPPPPPGDGPRRFERPAGENPPPPPRPRNEKD